MTEELCRAKFETWASDEGKNPRAVEIKSGIYILMSTRMYWESWKAAWNTRAEMEKSE